MMDEKKLEKLEKPEVEVIRFEENDVIATSPLGPGGGQDVIVPGDDDDIPG